MLLPRFVRFLNWHLAYAGKLGRMEAALGSECGKKTRRQAGYYAFILFEGERD